MNDPPSPTDAESGDSADSEANGDQELFLQKYARTFRTTADRLVERLTTAAPGADRGVREVIDEALGIAKYYRGGKNRVITSDVPADLPPLVGVRDQFVQVVFNLVLNAIDATGKGGRITVSADADAGGLVLSVSDDGSGIPPDVLPRLFRPYFTTKKHGTGLGLFVTRRLVIDHGGSVSFDSAPGEGTTFRVTLPLTVATPVLSTQEALAW